MRRGYLLVYSKFHGRPLVNNRKLIKNAQKHSYNSNAFVSRTFLLPLKHKAPKIPNFNTNQNFTATIVSSVNGLSTTNQNFLSFWYKRRISTLHIFGNTFYITLMTCCKNHTIIQLSVYIQTMSVNFLNTLYMQKRCLD